jgi:hypothetical protein
VEIQYSTIQLGKCANVAKKKPLEINMKTKLLTMLVMLAVAYAILMIGIDREDSRIESQKNAWQVQGYNIK